MMWPISVRVLILVALIAFVLAIGSRATTKRGNNPMPLAGAHDPKPAKPDTLSREWKPTR